MTRIGWDCEGPTPEPSWLEAIERLAPRTEYGHDWLLLRWEPGDWWDPVERWMIYQMQPLQRVSRDTLQWLWGRNPRDFGRYDRVKQRFVSSYKGHISYQQWRIFQEHRAYARPFWVVQGGGGGHKRRYSDIEESILVARGLPPEAPPPGVMAYAEPDNRTWSKIRDLDMVLRYGDLLKHLGRPGAIEMLDRREVETVRQMAVELDKWLTLSVEESLDLSYSQASALNSVARSDVPPIDIPEAQEHFVESLVRAYT